MNDLSVTAMYTSQVWLWGKLPQAELFDFHDARKVFKVTNFAFNILRVFRSKIPPLKHSLLHRHLMIDHFVKESKATQVIELAAGFSRRGASFSQDPNLRYIELDKENVIARKKQILGISEAGRTVLGRKTLNFYAGDATKVNFEDFATTDRPTIIIAEGLLMYLDLPTQEALWCRIASFLKKCPQGTFVFDLLRFSEQKHNSGDTLLHKEMVRYTGGHGFVKDDRSRKEIMNQLKEAGFKASGIFEPQHLASKCNLPFAHKKTTAYIFRCKTHKDNGVK